MTITLPRSSTFSEKALGVACLIAIAISTPTSSAQGVTCTGNKEYCDAVKVCEGYSSREGTQECMNNTYWTPLRNRRETSGQGSGQSPTRPAAGVTSGKNPAPRINGKAIQTCSHGGLCMGEMLRQMGIN
jgi:hypothetical protein